MRYPCRIEILAFTVAASDKRSKAIQRCAYRLNAGVDRLRLDRRFLFFTVARSLLDRSKLRRKNS